jgi:methionine-rich copper-binding protein CopC
MSRHTPFALVFAVAAITFGAATPAFGHATVTDSTPSNRSSVSEITEVSVTANEELLDIGGNGKGFVFTVRDANDHFFGDGCVAVYGDTASMPVELTASGTYTVAYRVVSNDGHPIEGSFSFRFDGTTSAEPAPAFAERPRCGVPQEPIPATEPTPEQTPPTETPPATAPATSSDDIDLTPWIGLGGVALIGGAIWALFRALGRSDSEDDLV